MVISIDNIENYCRICIKQLKSIKYNIFENLDEPDWSSTHKYLELDRTDGLPQYSCKACYRKIESVLQIRKTCLESAKTFREILNQTDVKLELDIDIEKVGKETILLDKECIEIKEKEENPEIENIELIEISSNLINDIDKTEDEIPLLAEDNIKSVFESINEQNSQLKTVNTLDNEKEDVRHFSSNNIIDKIEDETTVNHLKETSNNAKKRFKRKRRKIPEITTINELKGSSINKSTESRKSKRGQSGKLVVYGRIDEEISTESRKPNRGQNRKLTAHGTIDEVICTTSSKKRTTTIYNCTKCKKRFTKRNLYELHMKTEGLKPYPCPHCDQAFQHTQSFSEHINAYHTDDAIVYLCPMKKCKNSYKKFTALRKHCLRTHNASYVFIKQQAEKDVKLDVDIEKVEEVMSLNNSECTKFVEKQQKCEIENVELIEISSKLINDIDKTEDEISLFLEDNIKQEFKSTNEQNSQLQTAYTSDKEMEDLTHLSSNNILDIIEEETDANELKESFVNSAKKKSKRRIGITRKLVSNASNGKKIFSSSERISRNYECSKCGKVFQSRRAYEYHMRKKEGLKPYPCLQCGQDFESFNDLDSHVNANHADVTIVYSCPVKKCKETYVKLTSLRKHCYRNHKAGYNFLKEQIEKCKAEESENGDDQDESDDDESSVTDDKSKRKICSLCNKKHRNKENEEICIKVHAGLRPFVCHICSKTYKKKDALRDHMRLKHSEDPMSSDEKCEFEGCKTIFKNKAQLILHFKTAHKKKYFPKYDKIFVCPHCGKNFNRKERFQRHVHNHTGDFPFKCEKCKKGFLKRQEYEHHKLRCEGIKRFGCDLCEYKCVAQKQLKQHHESKHTKVEDRKKYSCSQCDFKTIVKQCLKNHERVVHLGIRDYKCEYCHRCFARPCQLKTHVMTHTGERPLQCTLCKRRFIQSQALKTHLKAHAKGTVRLKDEDKLTD